jgi:hypothetical protein
MVPNVHVITRLHETSRRGDEHIGQQNVPSVVPADQEETSLPSHLRDDDWAANRALHG